MIPIFLSFYMIKEFLKGAGRMPSANEWILSHRALVAALQLDAKEIVKPDGLCDGPTTQWVLYLFGK